MLILIICYIYIGLINRILGLVNQLQSRITLSALDALRNLCTQAYLMGKDELAVGIVKAGYVDCVSELIKKALTLLASGTQSASAIEL